MLTGMTSDTVVHPWRHPVLCQWQGRSWSPQDNNWTPQQAHRLIALADCRVDLDPDVTALLKDLLLGTRRAETVLGWMAALTTPQLRFVINFGNEIDTPPRSATVAAADAFQRRIDISYDGDRTAAEAGKDLVLSWWRVLGWDGPLAYAAGLSLGEAARMRDDNTLDRTALQTMAALHHDGAFR